MSIADVGRIRKTAMAGEQVSRGDVLILCDHVMEAIKRVDKLLEDVETLNELVKSNSRSKVLLVGAIFDAAVGAEMAEMTEGQKAKDIPRIMRDEILKLRRERDEWKAKAEQWEKEGIRLLHMLECRHDTDKDRPKGKLSMYLASRIEEIARGEE